MDDKNNISPKEDRNKYQNKHYSTEEIDKNDLMFQLVGEFIKTRKENHISQRDLENMTGIKQSVIARMECGKTDPQLSTVLNLLGAMGKTLSIVPLEMTDDYEVKKGSVIE